MKVFGKYSSYYNLLYKDKDYAGEAEYVHNLIQKYSPGAKNILDLGCGTGRHDLLLAEKGYSVTGVDQSEEMLAIAKANLSTLNSQPSTLNPQPSSLNPHSSSLNSQPSTLRFTQGNVRNIRLNETFDVVISLFHVMSYQITNEDLNAAFETAKTHLKKGGIFIFDCWYGPAVLTDKPIVRVKRMEDDNISVVRIAEPVMFPNENLVDVNYSVFIRDKKSGAIEELKETHRMRYLFLPEVVEFYEMNEMEIIFSNSWLTDHKAGFNSWNVCFGGVKKS